MTATGISQKEYLKKYLSAGGDGKKKKKKKAKAKPVTNRLRIVDDDVDIHNLRPLDDDELELYDLQEDAPQIAGIIDERPEEVKIKEKFGSSKWKVVADESDMGVKIIDKSKKVSDVQNNPVSHIHQGSGDDLSPARKGGKGAHDSDESPPRKSRRSEDHSPGEKRSQKHDSDESPPRKNKKSVDDSPVDKRSHKHELDVSPPRKNRKSADNSPVNKRSKKYDSDESPPRKNRRSLENSPVNKRSKKYDSDESPPRKNKRSMVNSPVNKISKKYDSDESPPRKHRRSIDNSPVNKRSHNQNSNESPPKRNHRRGETDVADVFPHQKTKSERDGVQQSRRRNYDSDESPVRKSRKTTPPKRRQGESPPHRKKRSDSEDTSLRAKGHKYDSDASPPRRSRKNGSQNSHSPPSRKKYDSDESPPRKAKRKSTESPPRRDSYKEFKTSHRKDISPYSRVSQRRDSPPSGRVGSKERLGHRSRKSDSDDSPPRHRRPGESTSPPRGKRQEWSPPKRERKRSSRSPEARLRRSRDVEQSSRRHSRWGDRGDVSGSAQRDFSTRVSPTYHRERSGGSTSFKEANRNDRKREGRNPSLQRRSERSDSDISPERKSKPTEKADSKKQTLDGRKAGLVGADELKAEIADLRHREKEMFEKMDASVSGRGAAAVMRDRKTGKKRDLEEEAREKQEKDQKQAERDAKYMEWGKGLKQVTDKAQKMEDALYEMSKPLARYADDADLDKYLRDQEREGDPMLQYIKSKTKSKEENSKPRYEGSFMPNRYGIRPGYRWDGVDRSNGYEKQWFETQNAKKAVEEEAYKWSTSDM